MKMLEEGFEKFKRSNQLSDTFPSEAKAKPLIDMMHGYAYRSRLGEQRQNLMANIGGKVEQVISYL